METMCSTTTCDALTGSYVIYPQLKHTVCEIHSYFCQKACDMPMICDRPKIKAAAYRIPVFHPTWCTGKVYQNILTLEYKGNQNSFLYMNPPWLPAPPVSQHNIASVTRSPSVGIEFACWWHCGALGRLLLFQCPPAGVSQQSAGSSIQLHLATPTGRELKYHLLWLLAHMAPCLSVLAAPALSMFAVLLPDSVAIYHWSCPVSSALLLCSFLSLVCLLPICSPSFLPALYIPCVGICIVS